MVAIGRALMGKPALLLLDEPSVGIAHRLKIEIFDAIKRIQKSGTAILMAEQDAQSALRIADRVYVLEHGRIGREGRAPSSAPTTTSARPTSVSADARARRRPDEARITSSASSGGGSAGCRPSRLSMSHLAAALPMASAGMRTVVSAGVSDAAKSRSSNPVTEGRAGRPVPLPKRRAARHKPGCRSCTSLPSAWSARLRTNDATRPCLRRPGTKPASSRSAAAAAAFGEGGHDGATRAAARSLLTAVPAMTPSRRWPWSSR